MRIRIKVTGHQHYHEIEGEVLLWSQGVAHFDGVSLQVPAVVIRTKNETVEVIPLQQALYDLKVEII